MKKIMFSSKIIKTELESLLILIICCKIFGKP